MRVSPFGYCRHLREYAKNASHRAKEPKPARRVNSVLMNRMLTRQLFIAISLLLFMGLFQGCSGGLSAKAMVPDAISVVPTVSNKTLQIAEVRGGEGKLGIFQSTAWSISNERFKEALSLALSESKLFRTVQIEGEGDIKLLVEIISCRPMNMMQSQYEVVVDYKFIERRSGKVVWEDTINTVYSSNAVSGNTSGL